MISLAGRDILHAWGKFVFTGIGLGLLIGVTLTMAGVYRGMVDDGKALLDNSRADIWVVQKDTLGPYAESSSLQDDLYRGILSLPGVAQAANVTYLTSQVRKENRVDVRAMVVGMAPGAAGVTPGWPPYLIAGRQVTRGHYEAVVDVAAFFEDDWREGKARPTRISRIDGQPMGAAGLWASWTGPEGDTIVSFTVLTLNANNHALLRRYQQPGSEKRMPVILNEGAYGAWLTVRLEKAKEFMRQYSASWLAANPVETKADKVPKGLFD